MQVWVITSQDGVERQRGWLGAHDGIMLNRKQATSFATTAAAVRALAALEEAVSSIGETIDWTFMVPDDGQHPYDADEPEDHYAFEVHGPAGGGWVSSWDREEGLVATSDQRGRALHVAQSDVVAIVADMAASLVTVRNVVKCTS